MLRIARIRVPKRLGRTHVRLRKMSWIDRARVLLATRVLVAGCVRTHRRRLSRDNVNLSASRIGAKLDAPSLRLRRSREGELNLDLPEVETTVGAESVAMRLTHQVARVITRVYHVPAAIGVSPHEMNEIFRVIETRFLTMSLVIEEVPHAMKVTHHGRKITRHVAATSHLAMKVSCSAINVANVSHDAAGPALRNRMKAAHRLRVTEVNLIETKVVRLVTKVLLQEMRAAHLATGPIFGGTKVAHLATRAHPPELKILPHVARVNLLKMNDPHVMKAALRAAEPNIIRMNGLHRITEVHLQEMKATRLVTDVNHRGM